MSRPSAEAGCGPAAAAADAAESPKKQLSLLWSACQTVAGSEPGQLPTMERSAVAAAAEDRAEPADADYEFHSGAATTSVGGPADCVSGGGGGSGGGGADTGYALSSPVTTSRGRSPTPPAVAVYTSDLTSNQTPAGNTATVAPVTNDNVTRSPFEPAEDVKVCPFAEGAAAKDDTETTGGHRPECPSAEREDNSQQNIGVPVPGGGCRPSCDVTRRPQQSPSEKVGAWLRNCLARVDSRNDDQDDEVQKQREAKPPPAAAVAMTGDGSTGSSASTEKAPDNAEVVAGGEEVQFIGDEGASSGGRPEIGSSSADEMQDALADAGSESVNVRQLLAHGCRLAEQPSATVPHTDTSSDDEQRWEDGALCSGGGGGYLGSAALECVAVVTTACRATDSGGAAEPRPPAASSDGGPLEVLDIEDEFGALPCHPLFPTPPRIVVPALNGRGTDGVGDGGTSPATDDVDVGDVVSDEDGDDGEDEAASDSVNSSDQLSPGDLPKRSTSLKSGKTPTRSRGQKKYVRFADAMGLDLQCVHTFRDEIPTVPAAAFRCLSGDLRTPPTLVTASASSPAAFQMSFGSASAERSAPSAPGRRLVPMFLQPGGGLGFTDRLHRDRVILESVSCRDDDISVRGVVRVLNLDYNKAVHVRHTSDGWRSWHEVDAEYVPGSCDGLSDRFAFTLYAGALPCGGQLQFVVSFTCRGETSWDNNGGRNYTVQLHETTPPSNQGSPPGGWTGGQF